MIVICVDDEPLVLQMNVSLCKDIPGISDAVGFTNAEDSLDWLKQNKAELAILDIDMPGINGLRLAAEMKTLQPEISVIFLTGYAQYALEAFGVHAAGYLLKPVSRERLTEEVAYALRGKQSKPFSSVEIKTFGNFDIFVDGSAITFDRTKAKEIMAYLTDRQGRFVSRSELFSILWEDGEYDRSMQKQLDVIIRSLRDTLEHNGIADSVEMKRGSLRLRTEMIECDFYRFLKGEIDSVNAYRGEYMNQYPWANMTEAFITMNFQKNI